MAPIRRLDVTYRDARARFIHAADERGARLQTFVHPTETGPFGEELAIDVASLGDMTSPNVLMIVSGTHGVEGYAGSALQSYWLESADVLEGHRVGVVLVHALNPFGFAWERRTNEDNIDLNRNFIDWSAPPPSNDDYNDVASLIVPPTWDERSQAVSSEALIQIAERDGFDAFQQVVSGGQYRHQAGVFYGGTEPAWSNRWLVDHAKVLIENAQRLGVVDLHTGLGPSGFGELIVHAERDEPACERAERWWGDVRSLQSGESVSSTLSGDWLGALPRLLPGVEITCAALEFGTIDPVSVLQALRAEAWMHNYGERKSDRADEVRRSVRAAFADDDPAWLATLIERFNSVISAAMAHLGTQG